MAEMAYTLMPEPNQTYLVQTKNVVVPAAPLSGSTVGFMMILSTSRAAFIQEGGQDFQNKLTSYATKNGIDAAHSIGLTDTEMGVVGFTFRTYQRKQLNVNGPKFYGIKSNLTLAPTNGNIGLKYEW